MKKEFLLIVAMVATLLVGCDKGENKGETNTAKSNTAKSDSPKTPETTESKDGYIASESGTEKEKPEAGKANVQGKALFNEKPAPNVEVKLCENFSTFMGCSGKQFTTKTDENGEYLFKNVEPKDYQGLIVKVFDTPSYIFASRSFGILSAKYKVEADKTFFAPATNLFKSDLKVQSPKSGGKIDANSLEIKWDAYPDAANYKLSIYPKDSKVSPDYINEKVDGTSFKPQKPLANGDYELKLEAYNANDVKLSTTKEDIKFNVTGGTAAEGTSATDANANK